MWELTAALVALGGFGLWMLVNKSEGMGHAEALTGNLEEERDARDELDRKESDADGVLDDIVSRLPDGS